MRRWREKWSNIAPSIGSGCLRRKSVQVETVLMMTEEHLDKLRKRKEEKEKRAEKSLGVRKTAFSTQKSADFDSSESITALSLTKEMTKVNGLKADPLRGYLEKTLRFPLAELKQEGGRKWKTVDVLKKMAEEKLNKKWEEGLLRWMTSFREHLFLPPLGFSLTPLLLNLFLLLLPPPPPLLLFPNLPSSSHHCLIFSPHPPLNYHPLFPPSFPPLSPPLPPPSSHF